MKKFIDKLNEAQKMILLASIVGIVFILISLIPFFVVNQTGWLIGISIGTVIEIINIFLLYKGSEVAMNELKTAWFLLFYFLRMLLFLAGFVVTAILSFGIRGMVSAVPAFQYSIWGVLIAYTPLQIIVVIVMCKTKKNIVNIAENNVKPEEKEKE